MSIQFKNGFYYVIINYRDHNNKKKNKWYKTDCRNMTQAEKWERNKRTDLERGDSVIGDKMRVEAFLNQWFEAIIVPKKRPSTIAYYKSLIATVSKGIGNAVLDKVSPIDIQTFINLELKRKIEPKWKEKTTKKPHIAPKKIEKTVSISTVKKEFDLLRYALDKAVAWGLIPKNPCDSVELPDNNKTEQKVYTPALAQTAQDKAKGEEIEVPILLGIQCGLRRGEVCGLRWSDINLKDKSVHINKSLDRMKIADAKEYEEKDGYEVIWESQYNSRSKSILVLGPVKTDESEGYIPLPENVVTILTALKKQQKKNKLKSPKYHDLDFVLCKENGLPWDPDYLYNQFIDFLDMNGLPKIRFHDLRHTHATLLLRSKVDIKIVSQKLRHKKASFTADTYQHVSEDMQQETADIMDKMFSGLDKRLDATKKPAR